MEPKETPHTLPSWMKAGKYELVAYEYYLEGSGEPWDRGKFANDIKSRDKNEDVRGVALLQLLPNRKLKAEFFPDKKAAEIAGFTPSAMIYERQVIHAARYACTGTCGGSVSEEEFRSGKKKCGTSGVRGTESCL